MANPNFSDFHDVAFQRFLVKEVADQRLKVLLKHFSL
jgi:hypothetical protein